MPPTPTTRDAIHRVMASGAIVTVVTGRMFSSARQSCEELNILAPIVSYQGAHVAESASGRVLWHQPMSAEMAHSALDALDTWKVETVVHYGGCAYVTRLTRWSEGYSQRNPGRVRVVPDLMELALKGPTRLLAVGDQDHVLELTRHLKAEFDTRLYVTRSLPHFCEILHPEGGKHRALEWLSRHLDIGRDNTIAFGNGADDVDMLRWAGLGVAVDGAAQEALDAADRIAPGIEEDGVARVLEELLERGLIG